MLVFYSLSCFLLSLLPPVFCRRFWNSHNSLNRNHRNIKWLFNWILDARLLGVSRKGDRCTRFLQWKIKFNVIKDFSLPYAMSAINCYATVDFLKEKNALKDFKQWKFWAEHQRTNALLEPWTFTNFESNSRLNIKWQVFVQENAFQIDDEVYQTNDL